MKLAELYECIFELEPESERVRAFYELIQKNNCIAAVRTILRQLNLAHREVQLFGNNTDELPADNLFNKKNIDDIFKDSHAKDTDAAKAVEEAPIVTTDNSFARLARVYLLHQNRIVGNYLERHITQWVYQVFGEVCEAKPLLILLDIQACEENRTYRQYPPKNPIALLEQAYPIDRAHWAKLILSQPQSESALLMWIAPLIQHKAGRILQSLKEVESVYEDLGDYEWSSDALIAWMQVACLLRQVVNPVGLLSDENLRTVTNDADKFAELVRIMHGNKQYQLHFISRIDNSFLNDGTVTTSQLGRITNEFDPSLRFVFLEQLTVPNVVQIFQKEPGYGNFNFFIENNFKDPKDKARFLGWLPNACIASNIPDTYYLKEILNIVPETDRYWFSKTKLDKSTVSNLKWNPYTLEYVVALFPVTYRVTWLRDNFTPEQLLAIKTGESRHHWNETFKPILASSQKKDLNYYLYPNEALTTHNAIKAIKREMKKVCWMPNDPLIEDVPQEDMITYTDINIHGGKSTMTVPPPVVKQIEVLRQLKTADISEAEGLKQLKEIGSQTQKELSTPNHRHRLFYQGAPKAYFDAFSDDKSFTAKFEK
jgi:hypothetical protein